jgi:hypothetical protein
MMTLSLPADVSRLLSDATTIKALSTVSADGVPHIEIPYALYAGDDGTLHYPELLESSETNRNLVRSIWFDAQVAIVLQSEDGQTIHIKGTVLKLHITGPLFQRHYSAIRDQLGDVDLAGVWVIRPDEIVDQSFAVAQAREAADHPVFVHLDRLAIN